MNFLQAYFISKVLAKSTKSKPRTPGEILKDSAQGWLFFLALLGCIALYGLFLSLALK